MEIDKARSIQGEILGSYTTGRELKYYLRYFNVTPDVMQGKRILDVGAGDSSFASRLHNRGVEAYRLDPRFRGRELIHGAPRVKGVGQSLPFRDSSFDMTFALFSLYWIETGLDDALKEMIRVTRNEGEIKIFPYSVKDRARVDAIPTVDLESDIARKGEAVTIQKNAAYSQEEWSCVADELLAAGDFNKYFDRNSNRYIRLGIDQKPWALEGSPKA